jgi:hypothetical protein
VLCLLALHRITRYQFDQWWNPCPRGDFFRGCNACRSVCVAEEVFWSRNCSKKVLRDAVDRRGESSKGSN